MSYSEAFEDAHFCQHPTPLQLEADARRRVFRASIDEQAKIAANPQRALPVWVPYASRIETEPKIKPEQAPEDQPEKPRYPSLPAIIRAVAAHYKVSGLDMISARRTANIVLPRHAGMYLAKMLTPRSLPQIGRAFGGRDHTSVIFAVNKVAGFVAGHVEVAARMDVIKGLLLGGVDAPN